MISINMNDIDKLSYLLDISRLTPSQIHEAENYLSQIKLNKGFSQLLLFIIKDQNNKCNDDIKINASIQLKNLLDMNYKQINSEDLNYIKINLIDLMCEIVKKTNFKIIKILNQAYFLIFNNDFINDFQFFQNIFANKILVLIKTNDKFNIFICVDVIYNVIKVFNYESQSKKTEFMHNFYNIFHNFFIDFLDKMTMSKENDDFIYKILYKILKIIYISIKYNIPPLLLEKNAINKYIDFILKLIENLCQNINEVAQKLIKISLLFIYRLLRKNYQYKLMKKEAIYLNYFKTNYIVKIKILIFDLYRKNVFQNENIKIIYKILIYFFTINNEKDILELFSNNKVKDKLIMDNFLTDNDIETWYNSPNSYIINIFTISEYKTIRDLTIDLIDSMLNNTNFLYYFISLLEINEKELNIEKEKIKNKNLNQKEEFIILNNSSSVIYYHKIKESLLYLIETILAKKNILNFDQFSCIINTYVIPELNNKFGFLRLRSCSFIKLILNYYKNNSNFNIDYNISIIKQLIFMISNDGQIQVKIISSIVLCEFLKKDEIKNYLITNKYENDIKSIIFLFIQLIDKIELDELIQSLYIIIQSFSNQINNIIISIIQYLTKYFISKADNLYITKDNIDTNNIEYYENILISVLKMILNIITIIKSDSEKLIDIENNIYPILKFCLSKKEGKNYLDVALNIIKNIFQNVKFINENEWSLYESIIEILNSIDKNDNSSYYFSSIIYIICSYIKKGTEFYLKNYHKNTLEVIDKLNIKFKNNFEKIRYLHQIIILLFETCKDQVKDINKSILEYIFKNFTNEYGYGLVNFGELFSCCIIYNIEDVINCIEILINNNKNEYFLINFFDYYTKSFPLVKKEFEVKRYLMALLYMVNHNKFYNILKEINVSYNKICNNNNITSFGFNEILKRLYRFIFKFSVDYLEILYKDKKIIASNDLTNEHNLLMDNVSEDESNDIINNEKDPQENLIISTADNDNDEGNIKLNILSNFNDASAPKQSEINDFYIGYDLNISEDNYLGNDITNENKFTDDYYYEETDISKGLFIDNFQVENVIMDTLNFLNKNDSVFKEYLQEEDITKLHNKLNKLLNINFNKVNGYLKNDCDDDYMNKNSVFETDNLFFDT